MSYRALGFMAAAAGAVLLAISVFADPLGLGGTDDFGWKQVAGAVLGGVVLVGGLAYACLPTRGDVEAGAEK